MRYAELTLRASGGFHPADHAIAEAGELERVAISQFSHLDDGTVVLLYQLRGDPGPAEAVLDADPDVLGYGLSQAGAEVHAHVHLAPNAIIRTLTRLPQRYPLVVELPVECLRDGGLRASVVGERETFAVAVETIPETVTVELASIRSYDPGTDRPAAALTARQREILDAALAAGYYDVPRRTTHTEIAAELDIAPATVGEHLRKIESRVLTRVTGGVDTA
ncbi:MAG: putative DNA binding protein [halophilic archaeon J07HX64]|jgi:Predicted DNA binding protein|nr:MAG: putative DNA binding protein [halophilic archaeon J07HX64]